MGKPRGGGRRWLRFFAGTVRLRLTLLYSGLFFVSGLGLVVATYFLFRDSTGVDLLVPTGPGVSPEVVHRVEAMYALALRRHSQGLHQGLERSGIALAVLTVVSIALGWVVAGRVLRPLRMMTAKTRQISERNLHERLELSGPRDELTDLADTVDGLLERLEAHVAEQERFAANASHELRTPLAITQTLLEVAGNDPNRNHDELVEHLHHLNSRAIELTEALLLLSRAGQKAFTPAAVDLSLLAEQAVETLLPLSEKHGVTFDVRTDAALTSGSAMLLLQVATNLVHNAIVHNRPGHGTVWVRTAAQRRFVELVVENTGERLDPQSVARLTEPFQRGTERIHTGHRGVGLGLAIVDRVARAHGGELTLTPRAGGGLLVAVRLPAGRSAGDA